MYLTFKKINSNSHSIKLEKILNLVFVHTVGNAIYHMADIYFDQATLLHNIPFYNSYIAVALILSLHYTKIHSIPLQR